MPESPRRAGNDGERLAQRCEFPLPASRIRVQTFSRLSEGITQDFFRINKAGGQTQELKSICHGKKNWP